MATGASLNDAGMAEKQHRCARCGRSFTREPGSYTSLCSTECRLVRPGEQAWPAEIEAVTRKIEALEFEVRWVICDGHRRALARQEIGRLTVRLEQLKSAAMAEPA